MYAQKIQALLNIIPELAEWSEIKSVFSRIGTQPRPDWEIPLIVCEAVGGNAEDALVGAAILACQQVSIMLVDDILDEDERGDHVQRGVGPTANIALALQAASYRLLDFAPITLTQKVALADSLSCLSLDTCFGQHLDTQNLTGEENYWRVIRAKSAPFYGRAYQIGAILGNAPEDVQRSLYDYGAIIGEIIQLEDDLHDAFQVPANPDWHQDRNNLIILFARKADYASKPRFEELMANISNEDVLLEAQQILIESGAVSFCAYHLIERFKEAQLLLTMMDLKNPAPLLNTLNAFAESLVKLLERGGLPVSKELFSHG